MKINVSTDYKQLCKPTRKFPNPTTFRTLGKLIKFSVILPSKTVGGFKVKNTLRAYKHTYKAKIY